MNEKKTICIKFSILLFLLSTLACAKQQGGEYKPLSKDALWEYGDPQKGLERPNPRFTDNGDGTVTDTKTGLMWLKDASACGRTDWESAKRYCANLTYAAYSDWRLPTESEFMGLGINPSGTWTKPEAPFVNVQSKGYWSSTESPFAPVAWCVHINNGHTSYLDKSSNHYVWPVRGGQ
jgi:hypothetical protein